jgi:hypothetical protein
MSPDIPPIINPLSILLKLIRQLAYFDYFRKTAFLNLRQPVEAKSENYAVQMYSDERPREFFQVQASERQSHEPW